MKSNIVIGTIFFTMIAVPGAYATTSVSSVTEPSPAPTATPTMEPTIAPSATPTLAPTSSPTVSPSPSATTTPNIDTHPRPSQELISQNPWANPTMGPKSQDEPEVWAIVDENGKTLQTTICDRDYCGSGWIPTQYGPNGKPTEFARVVLQSSRNPQTGQFNPGHSGNYNFNSNEWTSKVGLGENDPIYLMPTEHGSIPQCIENCPNPEPPRCESPFAFLWMEECPKFPVSSGSENSQISIQENQTVLQERTIVVKPSFINDNVVINKRVNDKIFKNEVLVIATKDSKKKVWTQQVSGKIVNIKIPRKYLFWNISIRYVVG